MANTKATPKPQVVKCQFCGKVLKRANSISNGQGHTCAQLQAKFTPAQLQAHYTGLTGNVPKGYITVASLHRTITAQAPNIPGLTVSKMVNCIGRDRGVLWAQFTAPSPTPVSIPTQGLHTIAKPIYNGKQRWVNGWLATKAGLQAIATGNFSQAPSGGYVTTPAK